MKVKTNDIKITARIRKQATNIKELSEDIKQNGLINPITVMSLKEGGYQLLAGLRRLRAAHELRWEEIEATVVPPKGAEEALRIEYSENEQREAFTFSEKMDYARIIAEIEKAKAKERMLSGKAVVNPTQHGAEGRKNRETRTIVGGKIGMSGYQYDRAKYIAENAPPEVINELDEGKRSIRSAFFETKDDNRKAKAPSQSTAVPAIKKPDLPLSDLERAIRAERELDAMKYRWHNEIYHRDSIIDNLKKRVAELETELEAAKVKIKELEGGKLPPVVKKEGK